MSDEQTVIYTTVHGTQYVTSPQGNFRDGEKIGREVYLSPANADLLSNNTLEKHPKKIKKDDLFGRGNSNLPAGRVAYEEFDGRLVLGGKVKTRDPPFGRNGDRKGVDDIVD